MEQVVVVTELLPQGRARVLHVRQSACSGDCHKCAGCGAAKETLCFTAANPIGARVGDRVLVSAPSGGVLGAAAILYTLPLVLFFALYALGVGLNIAPGLLGCGGFLLGIGVAALYGKHLEKGKKTDYTITGFAGTPG